jgi:hypothetical protein
MRRVAALAVAAVALAGCGSDDEKKSSGEGGGSSVAAAAPSTPAGAILAFYTAAARGDSATACDLLAPKADPANATASLLIAGTGSKVTTGTDCVSTIDTFHREQPDALTQALPKLETTEAGSPDKVDISRSDSGFKYHATLVQVGDEWRILEVVV